MTAPSPGDALAAIVQDFLTSLYETHPTLAASLGLHDYDGRVPDVSERGRAGRASALRGQAERAAAIPDAALGRDERHDATLVRLAIDEELFELESMRDFERNPLAYSGAIDVSNYVKRDYAPLERRIAAHQYAWAITQRYQARAAAPQPLGPLPAQSRPVVVDENGCATDSPLSWRSTLYTWLCRPP